MYGSGGTAAQGSQSVARGVGHGCDETVHGRSPAGDDQGGLDGRSIGRGLTEGTCSAQVRSGELLS